MKLPTCLASSPTYKADVGWSKSRPASKRQRQGFDGLKLLLFSGSRGKPEWGLEERIYEGGEHLCNSKGSLLKPTPRVRSRGLRNAKGGIISEKVWVGFSLSSEFFFFLSSRFSKFRFQAIFIKHDIQFGTRTPKTAAFTTFNQAFFGWKMPQIHPPPETRTPQTYPEMQFVPQSSHDETKKKPVHHQHFIQPHTEHEVHHII